MKQIIKHTNGTIAMQLNTRIKDAERKIYNLAAGDPNVSVPPAVKYGLTEAVCDGVHQYCDAAGIYELRKEIDDPKKVLIANGTKQLIYMSLMSTCEPGDTVLMIGPCWSSYKEMCKILNLNPVQYLPSPDVFGHNNLLDIKKYCEKYEPSVIILNNPSNPTGKVENQYFVEGLLHLCSKFDCWLLADEVYSDFVYEGEFYSLKNKSNRVIYINGFSKSFAITGWRLGYCIADPELIEAMALLQSQISGPPSTLIQQAILNAMKTNEYKPIDKEIFKNRRDLIAACSPLLERYKPQAGFYFYVPVEDSEKARQQLLEHAIVVTPGEEYGLPNTIRLSFANITATEIEEISPYLKLLS